MSSANKTLLIVSYDIIEDKKRTAVAKKLQDYGQRVQYSVFECFLTKKEYLEMLEKIKNHLDMEKDNLRIYKICNACSKRIFSMGVGRGWKESDEDRVIVI